MLPISLNYNSIFASPHETEIMMIVGEVGGTRTTIPMGNIKSLNTHYSLYGDYYDIGNAVIGSFDAVVTGFTPTQIPKFSRVEVWYRIKNSTQTSGWVCKGIYYTKRPEYDKESGDMSLSGYDLMFKGEMIPYPVGSTVSGWNSETLATVAQRMATAMGISLYPFLTLRTDAFALPPFGYSAREILCDIAKAHGANWYLTYINDGDETTPVGGAYLNLREINGWGTPSSAPNLAKSVQSYDEGGEIESVGYVIVNYGYDQDGATLSKFSGTEGVGRTVEYTISTITDGAVIQTLADNILYEYGQVTSCDPFTATGTELDPAYEVGDMVNCNGSSAPIGSLDTHFSVAMYADIAAQGTPEEEDFPYYSSDRDIVRNYETEASKIAGAVKFVDLSTAGGTVINGSNIQGGTLTLGGNNNGNGQMQILDENDVQYAVWDKGCLLIRDDIADINDDTTAKLKVIRMGDVDNTKYGVFIGTMQLYNTFFPGTYPNEVEPFVSIYGASDYTDPNAGIGSVMLYPNNVSISDGSGNSTVIATLPKNAGSLITRSSGASISSQTAKTWGRMVSIQLVLAGDGAWHAAGTPNLFQGMMSDYLPATGEAFGVGYYDGAALVGRIQSDGTVTVRVTGQGMQFNSGGGAVITWTYLF